MKKIKFAIMLISLLIVGCASNPMDVTTESKVQEAAPNEAQIVFMRDSLLGAAISSSLFDITNPNNDPVFVGILNNNTKVIYKTEPGPHLFMVIGESADFMSANIIKGKTYYSLVTPRMGIWKARFSLWPIKPNVDADYSYSDKKNFNQWNNTHIALITDKALSWYNNNKDNIIEKRNDYITDWNEYSADSKAKRTLDKNDYYQDL
ncbi:putative periplasmic lipoprotein [Vibrio algicola]|uniref:Lipoprotein n=1 Tax=Vibrio algicola TaxID=2662262 RepID=A0A5Q0TP75_9VIBR|nr:hypothetical protein [Vibrio algicola]